MNDPVPDRRVPFDVTGYELRARQGPCFICSLVGGNPGYRHEVVYEDERHIAFLDRHPTMVGRTLVAPKPHIEHAVRDLDERNYLALMAVVRRVALAVEASVPTERTYLLSLGSRQGNAHLHWHVAPLPPGVPYGHQQHYALMTENGVVSQTPEQVAEVAGRIRAHLDRG
jgi:diadenosine tetraphosphate (Ap4A) HIT family hydrolase